MELPYAEPLTVREPGPRVIPEPPRRGEPGGEPCGLCSGGATSAVWGDEYFTLHPPVGGSMKFFASSIPSGRDRSQTWKCAPPSPQR